jgi:peptidoglycan/LPS O-acetylase OafA/YrhL
LKVAPIRWLGRVSYSFYLWHFVVLYVLSTWLLVRLNPLLLSSNPITFGCLIAGSSVVVTCVFSEISYRFVEIPYMEYGRRLVANALPNKSDEAPHAEHRNVSELTEVENATLVERDLRESKS